MNAPRAQYAFNGDVAIAFGVVGEGPVDVVYVQGYVSDVELMWDCPQAVAFFERIAAWARLITLDRRGTGMSDRFSADRLPPLEDAAADIMAVMDAAGSERASIFGHHEGGQLGAMLAALHPERVRTLSLFATPVSWRAANEQMEGRIYEDAELNEFIYGWRRTFGTAAEEQRFFEQMAPSHPGDRQLFRFLSRLQRHAASPDSAVGFGKLLFETDISGILGTISVPTQVLHRADDRMLDIELGRRLAAAIPNADMVELPGGDWWPFLGDVDSLLDRVEAFILGSDIAPPMRTASRVLATVLFTDIVDSTARSASLGDAAWADIRRRHDVVVRQALAGSGGREIKTMGDGFLATFEGPARAVECAHTLVREVGELGLQIRAGLHTGEVTFEGSDVSGLGVAIGARVAALAQPGEILVSQTVKDLVAGSGLEFSEAGEHELKGVPERWRLYRVVN